MFQHTGDLKKSFIKLQEGLGVSKSRQYTFHSEIKIPRMFMC